MILLPSALSQCPFLPLNLLRADHCACLTTTSPDPCSSRFHLPDVDAKRVRDVTCRAMRREWSYSAACALVGCVSGEGCAVGTGRVAVGHRSFLMTRSAVVTSRRGDCGRRGRRSGGRGCRSWSWSRRGAPKVLGLCGCRGRAPGGALRRSAERCDR
jgi:hypothetical protein